jgi:hypothetical protein
MVNHPSIAGTLVVAISDLMWVLGRLRRVSI